MARILVLEDDPLCVSTMYAFLSDVSSHEYDIYDNVDHAEKAFLGGTYNLVICDLHLRGGGRQGNDLITSVRSRNANVPIIVLTGMEYIAMHRGREGETIFQGIKVTRQIKKPIEYTALLSAIDEAIKDI